MYMKKNKLTIILFSMFVLLLGLTIYTGLGVMADEPEIIVKKTSLVYDQTSGVEIDEGNIIFNDKNQTIDYKILVENTQDYDIKISDIKISLPTEDFLKYEAEALSDDIVKANSTKEIVLSLETTGIKGWGRNFNDNLTANISFDKLEKESVVTPPIEEDKKEEEKPPIEEEKEAEKEESSKEEPKEESSNDEINKEENLTEEEIENVVENPYTSDKDLVIVLGIMTTITGALVLVVSKNKVSRYAVLVILLGTTLSTTNAETLISIHLNINVNFKSQNIMEAAYVLDNNSKDYVEFWDYSSKIKNIYIQNEKKKIAEYVRTFDVSLESNQRVKAYLVSNEDNSAYYDLYIQADGIIYPNQDASYYFYNMTYLDEIHNIEGLDTSNVKNMSYMFYNTGYNSTEFKLDISKFDTSNVANMSYMFYNTGYNSTKFNTSVTISNPNVKSYDNMFTGVATKTGTEIKVNYTEETKELVDKMIATKSSTSCVYTITPIDFDNLSIGDEINIKTEKFNVISQTEDTITMLAKYNLGTNYRQSATANKVSFSKETGWEYKPGPKEIDIQTWSTDPKVYVNNYVSYLQTVLEDTSISGDLITLTELKALGCVVPTDYAGISDYSGRTCINSPYKSWLINGQYWWTRSASSGSSSYMWVLSAGGGLYSNSYSRDNGVRPVITISKEILKKLNN